MANNQVQAAGMEWLTKVFPLIPYVHTFNLCEQQLIYIYIYISSHRWK